MRLNAKKNHKRVSYRIFICDRDFLVYINFNFDFLDIHNEFFESYFANELTRIKTFAVRVLSDHASLFLILKTLLLMF
jgi:hypothetical protein